MQGLHCGDNVRNLGRCAALSTESLHSSLGSQEGVAPLYIRVGRGGVTIQSIETKYERNANVKRSCTDNIVNHPSAAVRGAVPRPENVGKHAAHHHAL